MRTRLGQQRGYRVWSGGRYAVLRSLSFAEKPMADPDNRGARFQHQSVVDRYRLRPPYSPEVFDTLVGLIPAGRRGDVRVLDIGCGPGKLTFGLRSRVAAIDAVDPSEAMLTAACASEGGDDPAIRWICAKAEDAPVDGPYDLVVAGASFHWMDAGRVLERCRSWLGPGAMFAVLDGDDAVNPPWLDARRELVLNYIERLIGTKPTWNPSALEAPLIEHVDFAQHGHHITAPVRFRQTIADYVQCQHSRATFALETMDPDLATAFDRDLAAMVEPYAKDGWIEFDVQSRITWGRPRY